MEKVAEHINEMQRIHEEYGAIFDHLFRQHQKSCKQVQFIITLPLKISLLTPLFIAHRFKPRRSSLLWRRGVAKHFRLPWENQERSRTTCDVLCIQIGCGVPVQRTP